MNLFFGRRHLFARFEADQLHLASSHTQRRARDVHELFHSDVHLAVSQLFRQYSSFVRFRGLVLFAHGRSSNIDRDVTAADDYKLFADRKTVTKIYIQEEIDAFYDAVQIMPG